MRTASISAVSRHTAITITSSNTLARLLARRWELAGYVSLLLAAGIMRLWDLGARAMHHDESLHVYYSWLLSKGDGYQHHPMMHGPFQFEANAALFTVFGDNDYTARLLYALAGTALVGAPYFLRHRLGRLGALIVAALLVFSPALLYFSRFARNDILMAAWTLGLVICLWRYLDEGKPRYLYAASALLALAFSTKETAYITTLVLGLFLLLLVSPSGWAWLRRPGGTPAVSSRNVNLAKISRPASFLVLMVTLTLPLWSALVSIFQDTPLLRWSGLIFASSGGNAIGAPSGGGLVIAALVVVILLALAIYSGSRWNWPVWWRCALIFYGIWVLLYTTFFTNLVGLGSGAWQSMGYWIVQQGEARGNQPWYYYFVITSVYEFLPLLFGVIAAVYYMRRRDIFGHFLVFWAAASFILYTLASEKMPWLLVNVALPLVVLAGKFLADIFQGIQWRRLLPGCSILVLPGVPAFLFLLWQLAFFQSRDGRATNVLILLVLVAALLILAAVGVYLARRVGVRNFAAFAVLPVALVLLALTIRAGARASYQNGDIPVEMIVYTQTSPDVLRLRQEIERAGNVTGEQRDVAIAVDGTSGFAWPWAWYLRDYSRVSYLSLEGSTSQAVPDASVVVVHSQNKAKADQLLQGRYTQGQRIKHRWWFPEETYRDLTIGKFLGSFADREAWRRAMDYFMSRQGVRERLGSEDAYVYFSPDFPQDFSPSLQ